MAWTNSKIFQQFPTDSFNSTASFNIDADNIKAALFDNSITPNQTGAASATAYGAAPWNAGGVLDASGWPAVGRQLLSVTSTVATSTFTFDAADTVSANSSTTLTNAFGCLIYNDTIASPVAKQGLCYNYFGGANSVTSGTFTIVWNASGLFTVAM